MYYFDASLFTHLAVDELEISWALRIAITSAVLCSSLVVGEFGHATIGIHLGEVQSTVQPTGEIGDINVKGELLVEELEYLIVGLACHQVNTGSDVLPGALCYELESERVATGGDTVSSSIVRTIDGAVLGTGHTIGTEGSVPGVTGVAVRVPSGGMEPAPVSIKYDGTCRVRRASRRRACLPTHRRMSLSSLSTHLLSIDGSDEGEKEESGLVKHVRLVL